MLPTWMFSWNTKFTAGMNYWLNCTADITSNHMSSKIQWLCGHEIKITLLYTTTSLLFKLWPSRLCLQGQHCAHHNHSNIPASETCPTLISFIDFKTKIKQIPSSIQWFLYFFKYHRIVNILVFSAAPFWQNVSEMPLKLKRNRNFETLWPKYISRAFFHYCLLPLKWLSGQPQVPLPAPPVPVNTAPTVTWLPGQWLAQSSGG